MEHQDQNAEQKVPLVTDTNTMQFPIENKNKPTDDLPPVDEPENKDGNASIQSASFQDSNYIPHTPRQSSSHNQNGNSSPSNSPPDNVPPNNHLPNQINKDQPTFTYDSGPRQTFNSTPVATPEASPTTTKVSNNNSFNASTTNDNSSQVNNYFNIWGNVKMSSFPVGCTIVEVDDTQDLGTGVNIHQEEKSQWEMLTQSDNVPTTRTPTTKVDLAVPQSLNTHIASSELDTLSKPGVQAPSPSPSTSTTYHVHEGGLASVSSESLPTGQECHNLGHTSIETRVPEVDASATAGRSSEQGTVLQLASAPEHALGVSNLHPSLREGLERIGNVDMTIEKRRVRHIFANSVNQLRHSAQSIKSSFKSGTQSMTSSKPFSSIATLSARSKVYTPLKFVERVPVVPLEGKKKKFPENVDVHIHAKLDPFPGLEPFHPLRDPSMSHMWLEDGSLPPVYSVNIYDVGYFDGAGRFTLLFNLQMTKEENEKLLKFQFKSTSFLPLTGGIVHSSPLSKKKFQVWNDKYILTDRISSANNESNFLEYMCRFKVRSHIKHGTGIVMMGQVRRYVDLADVVRTQRDYFEAQSTEWYRHAKGERNHNIENGDLVLITECYKAPSWGYINYQSEKRTTQASWAAFQPGMTGKGEYGWVYESPLVGLESSQHQSTEEDPTAGPPNQCIGVRAYTIRCDPQAWKPLCRELEAARTPRP